MSVYICVYLQRLSLDFFFFWGGEGGPQVAVKRDLLVQ